MSELDRLIASWKARRVFLTEQVEKLKRGEMSHEREGIAGLGQPNTDLVKEDIDRTQAWISELNDLLVKYSR
jgi:hypothetical protein